MHNKRKALTYSPLMGSAIATCLFLSFVIIQGLRNAGIEQYHNAASMTSAIMGTLFAVPFMFVIFSLISYLLSFSVGIILYRIKKRYFLTEGAFWFMTFTVGSAIGLIVSFFNYQAEGILLKSIIIFISFSLGALFSSSLFSVLTGQIQRKK